jgi:nicotinate-nucleotide adenylyltransferase
MGGDNLATLHKWKNYEKILENFDIYIYQRPEIHLAADLIPIRAVVLQDFPLLNISSTYIRKCLRKGISIQYLVPDAVFEYLEGSSMYRG